MESTTSHINTQLSHDETRWNRRDPSTVNLEEDRQPYSPPQFEKHRSTGLHQGQFATANEGNNSHYRSPQAERPYHQTRSWDGPESATYSHSNRINQQQPINHGPPENSGYHHYAYGPPPVPYPNHTSSSFESYGSTHGPYPPQYVVSGPMVAYPFGPGMHPGGYYQAWGPPPKPVEYIRDIKSGDVLCGRGGATNSHPGNRSFRSLVKRHQDRYLRAKKRDKPAVASTIVELIRERGGRFLRRAETSMQGEVLWVDIGDERAREKTCQALREGAPELRRRRRGGSSSDEEDKDESPKKKIAISRTRSISEDEHGKMSPKSDESSMSSRAKKIDPRSDSHDDRDSPGETNSMKISDEGPLVIRPCSRLMRRPVRDIALSDLSSREQQMYLHDFLPPHPNIKEGSRRKRILIANPMYSPASDTHGDDRESWEV